MNSLINKIKACIDMHNAKVANFDDVISKAKKCIERHYIQEQIEQLQYNEKKETLQQFKDNLKKN